LPDCPREGSAVVDDELGALLDTEVDIGRTRSRCWRATSGPISASGSVPGTDLQRPDPLARSRVWIRGDEPRIGVGRLDDPYRDDARVSAVRRYE
jgi:hypothetical protein